MTRFFFVLTLLANMAWAGCGPSQEELDQERARVSALQSRLEAARKNKADLRNRLDELQAANDQLLEKLEVLGSSLEEAQGDRTNLQAALARLQAKQEQAQQRLATFRDLLKRFKSMIESGRLTVEIDRKRNLMLVKLPESVLFDSGKARLKTEGEAALAEVAQILAEIRNRSFQVAGHTDDRPIKTRRFPSNWELSAARAVNVVRYLIAQGMSPRVLAAAGYADTQPIASNDTPESRSRNRRIEIVLTPNLDELPDLGAIERELSNEG